MIEIKNVTESYVDGIKVIDDLSLTIDDGIVFGFIGPNGARKDNNTWNDNRCS